VTVWLALLALALQAASPLTASATAVSPDICGVGGPVPMPDPASPECRMHCVSSLSGAGQAALDAPREPELRRPDGGILRLAPGAHFASPAAPYALATPARAPPAFS